MRYADGGGVDRAGRDRREQVRLRAAEMFAQGMHPTVVAQVLEVSSKPGCQWRRTWEAGGPLALASKGPPGPDRLLSDTAQNKLAVRWDQGAIAAGYPDERWALAR